MKGAAAVVAVSLVAVANVQAGHREHARQVAAADRVDATLIAAAGQVHDQEFELTLLVVNRGSTPITVKADRRVVPGLYDAQPFEDRVVDPGVTEELAVPFRAHCPMPAEQSLQRIKLVVPIAPASGRVRDVATDVDPGMLWDFSRRACGYLSADEAADPSVSGVTSSRYAVRFLLLLRNRSDRPFDLMNLTSPGLALSVFGGVPVTVGPGVSAPLRVSVALPACSRLPAAGFGGRGAGAQRFGTIVLELRDDNGDLQTKPYLPTAELSTALAGLRLRICPQSVQVPSSRTRSRFG